MDLKVQRSPPFYDSLLVKVTAFGRTFDDTRRKAIRALSEMVVKGVKTNIAFMLNVLNHPTFAAGMCDTGFIANTPDLMNIESQGRRAESYRIPGQQIRQ